VLSPSKRGGETGYTGETRRKRASRDGLRERSVPGPRARPALEGERTPRARGGKVYFQEKERTGDDIETQKRVMRKGVAEREQRKYQRELRGHERGGGGGGGR